jgi:hypothetical protein
MSEGTDIPLLPLRLALDFVYDKDFNSVSSAQINENPFFTRPPCLLNSAYTSLICSWHPPVEKTEKAVDFFKRRFFTSSMKSITN